MNRRPILACLLILAAAADPATGQTKSYFDGQCSYTAPGVEWQWLDVKSAQGEETRTLALVRNPSGLTFTLRYRPTAQRPDGNSFGQLEENLLAGGARKKLDSRKVSFKGVTCYEVDVQSIRADECARVRFLIANEKVYQLSVTYAPGPLGPTEETDVIFHGFEFRSDEDQKRDEEEEKGRDFKPTPLVAWIGALASIAGLIWMVVRIRNAAVK
jgi:hypothetical protein